MVWSGVEMTARAYTVPTWPVRVRTCSLDSMSHTCRSGTGRSEPQTGDSGPEAGPGPRRPSYVDEVLIGAADDVVIRHSNRVDAATRCLQDMDAVEGPDVPDLQTSSGHLVPGRAPHPPRASEPLDTVSSPATGQKACEGLWPSNEGTAELGPPAAGLRGAGAGRAHRRTLIVW